MKRIIEILLITVLYACAVTPSENETFNLSTDDKSKENQWVGQTVDELIVLVGEPLNVYTLKGGGRMFEYLQPKKIATTKATTSTQRYLSAEDERKRRLREKHKDSELEQSQDCKILFKISASDIIESWSVECEK